MQCYVTYNETTQVAMCLGETCYLMTLFTKKAPQYLWDCVSTVSAASGRYWL